MSLSENINLIEEDFTHVEFTETEKKDLAIGEKRARNRKTIEDIKMRRELEEMGISASEYHSVFE